VLVEVALADKSAATAGVGQAIAHDLALHIASVGPKYVAVADIPAGVLAAQRDQLWAQTADLDKPEAIKEKIVAGRLNKFYEQNCLLAQPFLKDDSLTVAEWLAAQSEVVGTAVSVTRFVRAEIAP
jgi:elongation factor Ts